MLTAGIITEYNPFHNGHRYQIEQTRSELDCSHIISVMSGNFLQRGLPAVCNKFMRAEMAVASGVDAVFELPVVYATASAKDFAYAGIDLLNKLNTVDYLVFGAECDDLSLLESVAEILIDEPASFSACLKKNLSKGMSYPSARADAIKSCCPAGTDLLKEPNNILAVEYLSALKKTRSSIKPYIIKRTSAGYNSEDITGSICSASAIRHLLQQINTDHTEEPDALFKTFYQVLPAVSADLLKTEYLHTYPIFENHLTSILQYCLIMQNDAPDTVDMTDELYNKLKKTNLLQSYAAIAESLKSKDLTQTRINRALLHFILGIRKNTMSMYKESGWNHYGHILALNRSGSDVIRQIKRNSDLPVFTKPADGIRFLSDTGRLLFEQDIKATRLYNTAVYAAYKTELPDDFTARLPVRS